MGDKKKVPQTKHTKNVVQALGRRARKKTASISLALAKLANEKTNREVSQIETEVRTKPWKLGNTQRATDVFVWDVTRMMLLMLPSASLVDSRFMS